MRIADLPQDHSPPPMGASEAAVDGGWRLTDLIDVRTLQSIQDTFARAFGLPTVIVHPDGSNATDITHRVTFCEDLTRTSKLGGQRCLECDLRAMQKAHRTSQPAIFHCWNGLYDCAIPISCKGQTLGYFLCGQILMDEPDPELYAARALDIGVSPEAYLDALADVRRVDFARYEASVQSMHVLAEMIAEQAAAAIDNLAMLEDAEQARADAARLLGELDAILEGLHEIGSQPDYQATLQAVAESLDRLIPWDSCVIYLVDAVQRDLMPVVVRDPYPEQVARFRPRLGQSIAGQVALTGVGRRLSDVTQAGDFEPIPGVPIEPEAMLAMPMVYRDAVSGVIVLSRFERRTFTDHEFQVLGAFCSQASVSIQLSKLASDNAQRLREEQALSRLLRTISATTGLDAMLADAAQTALDLLDVQASVITADVPGARLAGPVSVGVSEAVAKELVDSLRETIDRSGERGAPIEVEADGRRALVVPVGGTTGAHGTAILLGRRDHVWDERLARAFASQLAVGLEKTRLHEREHRQLHDYRQLSELATELAHATDPRELEDQLLAKTRGVLSGDMAWLAMLGQGPDSIEIVMLDGPRVDRFVIGMEGPGRVATLRLRDEPRCGRSVYDTWAHEIQARVGERAKLGAFMSEPLSVSTGTLGGLFVGWRSERPRALAEPARMLGVVASAAGASLARLAAYQQTDATLRERVVDLETLTQLAQRLTGLRDEEPIIDEILSSFRRLGRLDGAVYAVRDEGGVGVRRALGLSSEETAELVALHSTISDETEPRRIVLESSQREAVFLAAPRAGMHDAFFAGVGAGHSDPQRNGALQMIARYGSVALENADLHQRQRLAIARLQQEQRETAAQATKLEQVLSAHETLASAVLDGQGLQSLASSLGPFISGEVVIVNSEGRVRARFPDDVALEWRPDPGAGDRHAVEMACDDGTHVLAAPAVVEGEPFGWVIARLRRPAGDVERAAVEYGALLTALELLRERTAAEIEYRLRGGLLEDLFTGEFVDELISKHAVALGLDLSAENRVFLIEALAPDGASGIPVDPERLLPTVAGVTSTVSGSLVALRGTAVVAVVPEDVKHQRERLLFEDRLRRALRERLPGFACAIAVGTLCHAPRDYRDSFLASRRGLDLLRLQGRHDEVFSFRQPTVATMLLRSSEPEVILEFVSRYVKPLDAYDIEHTSELRRTAETFFEVGGNLEQAARCLHVHVSTLRYRLGRIAELTGIDLKDRRAMLDLQVALEAAQPLAVHRGQAPARRSTRRQKASPRDRQGDA